MNNQEQQNKDATCYQYDLCFPFHETNVQDSVCKIYSSFIPVFNKTSILCY